MQKVASQEQISVDLLLTHLLDTYESATADAVSITPTQSNKIPPVYKSFFDNFLTMVPDAVISINRDEEIIIFNKKAETIFGYSQQEIIGQSLSKLIPERSRSAHGHHIQSFADTELMPRLMATERSELKGRRKDGQEFFMIASISRLQFGEEIILTAIVRDITKEKKAEEALHQQKQRYDELVARIPAMVYRIYRTPQGDYQFDYVSPRVRDLNKIEPEEVLKDFNILHNQTHPEDIAGAMRLQERSAMELSPFIWKGRVIVDGEIRWHHIESSPRIMADGTYLFSYP